MSDRTCSIAGCERTSWCRGWCQRHYNVWHQHGDPTARAISEKSSRIMSVEDTFRFYMPGDPPPEGVPWIWNGTINNNGYGQFQVAKKVHLAHRISYELFVGPIPDGLQIRHRNDRPLDVNPWNLETGTIGDNMRDKFERGRQARGGQHGMAKLTAGEVLAIRAAYEVDRMSHRSIARRYGISHNHVGRIIRRDVWATI